MRRLRVLARGISTVVGPGAEHGIAPLEEGTGAARVAPQ
jgi:hypothetical protein